MHQGPQQPPTTREAPAAASSSRSPPLAPITCDALTASSITVITVPSSSVQFLVPRDGKNNETSHYKRDVPKMWRPWGKLTGTKVLKDLEDRLQSFEGSFKQAGEDPMTLFGKFWSDLLKPRVHCRIDVDLLQVIYIYIYIDTYRYRSIYIYIYKYRYIYIYIDIYRYIYTDIYIDIYTYTDLYIYIYIYM
jgi:hypothetical protein